MSYDVFEVLLEDEEVVAWLVEKYMKLSACISQFSSTIGTGNGDADVDNKVFYIMEAAAGLIVRMGMDPHYVMYEMDQWEMTSYYDMMQSMERDRLTEERLWTYLKVLPHVGKKLSGPEKLIPFPWDKEKTDKIQKELEKNSASAFAFLTGNRNNGKG